MTAITTINHTESALLQYLMYSLHPSGGFPPALSVKEWERMLALADRHEVLPLLANVLDADGMPTDQWLAVQEKTARTVHKGISLQVLNASLTTLLEKEGILAVTMKGCAVSRLYPVPEYRKTSDIDLFVADEKDARRAVRILCKNGFSISEENHVRHHIVLISNKKEVVELHTAWTEPFRDKRLNQYLKTVQRESGRHCHLVNCQGLRVYAYDTTWQGYYLLLHMLQHFMGSGFGLRNLCDWVVMWEQCDDEKARNDFWKMVCESGTGAFAEAVTVLCTKYLGLTPEKCPIPAENLEMDQDVADALLRDILDAGEFGYSEAARMVGLDGNSLKAYLREFHHQMHIRFPRAGRVVFLWPILWCATLLRFLFNNHKLHRPSVTAIMEKAGKRGLLVNQVMFPKKDKR